MFDQPIIGAIIAFAGTFDPKYWMLCNGQLLPKGQFLSLYAALGETFGGNGKDLFAVPNLNGRVAVHEGLDRQGNRYIKGETGGNEHDKVFISANNLPAHDHTINITGKAKCSTTPGTVDSPEGNYPAPVNGSPNAYSTVTSNGVNMVGYEQSMESPVSTPPHEQEPFPVMSPYCTMRYIICFSDGRNP